MIDNVTVLNLPHRIDRKNFMIGHLETIEVPLHIINFFPAKYGKDYESVEAIKADMVADGFDFMKHVDMSWQDNLAAFCYYWNWLAILRDFSQSSRNSLLMLDDRMLKIDWETLGETVAFLCRSYSPFRMLQLGWTALWRGERQQIEPVTGLVAKGIRASGDYATVLSNEGAQWLFNELVNTRKNPEALFFALSQPGVDNTGFFHMIKSRTKNVGLAWRQDIWQSEK